MATRLKWFALSAVLSVTCAVAAEPDRVMPAALKRLATCVGIKDDGQRLACYDREVAAFFSAEKASDVVVVDRAEVRKARRSLFGLSLPDLGIFGGDKEDKAEKQAFSEIETALRSAAISNGNWLLVLEDGARWIQTDGIQMARDARAGDRIRIRKAPVGGYFANVAGQRAIRVRRIN